MPVFVVIPRGAGLGRAAERPIKEAAGRRTGIGHGPRDEGEGLSLRSLLGRHILRRRRTFCVRHPAYGVQLCTPR